MFLTDPKLPVKERIKLLERRELDIFDEIEKLDFNRKDIDDKINKIMLDWALVIEEQHALGSYIKGVDTICSRIVYILKENNLDGLTKYAYGLPDKYKQIKYKNAGLFGSATRSSPFNRVERIVESELDNYRELEKEEYFKNMLADERKYPVFLPSNTPVDTLDNDDLRRKYDLIKEAKARIREEQNEIEELIKRNNIAIFGQKAPEHISTEKPEQKETTLYYAIDDSIHKLEKLIETLEQVKNKVKEFPPSEEDSEVYVKGYNTFMVTFVDTLNEFFKPIKDEKWSQSWAAWFKTMLYEIDHGKHAAGKMSKIFTHKGDSRWLTREQVGDKKEDVYKFVLKMFELIKIFSYMSDYHRKYMQPRIADRKNRLSPVLSDQA